MEQFCGSVAGTADASRGVGRSAECCKRRSTGRMSCLVPPWTRCFQRSDGLPSPPAPDLVRSRVHPLLSSTSPSEFVAASHLPDTRKYRAPPRVSLSFATSACGVHFTPGFHTRLRSAHSVSHALDGFLLRVPRGLVSSRSHVRDSHFRESPPLPSRSVSSTCRALLSLARFSCRRVAPPVPDPLASPTGR